jgi:hypothetical protein
VEVGLFAEKGVEMEAAILAIIIIISIALTIQGLGTKFSKLRNLYFLGIVLWSRWLPVLAALTFICILGANVVGGDTSFHKLLSLRSVLSYPETMILLLLSPIMFTRAANLIAAGALLYLLQRLFFSDAHIVSGAWLTMIASTTTLAMLADRMPWVAIQGTTSVAVSIREVVINMIALGLLIASMFSLTKVSQFVLWSDTNFSLTLSASVVSGVLGAMMVGWVCISMGLKRHFILPLLSLPSLFVLAFITSWPPYMLVVPFAAILALSLSSIDFRVRVRA